MCPGDIFLPCAPSFLPLQLLLSKYYPLNWPFVVMWTRLAKPCDSPSSRNGFIFAYSLGPLLWVLSQFWVGLSSRIFSNNRNVPSSSQANIASISPVWFSSTSEVVRLTEELHFKFCLVLTNLNYNHMLESSSAREIELLKFCNDQSLWLSFSYSSH